MNKMKFKKLNVSLNLDKKILLTYFYKKLNTNLNKNELLKLSCIHYDSEQKSLVSLTKRFKEALEPYQNETIYNNDVENIVQKISNSSLKLQEELVQCTFSLDNANDHFYIAVIGADFFMTETELRK